MSLLHRSIRKSSRLLEERGMIERDRLNHPPVSDAALGEEQPGSLASSVRTTHKPRRSGTGRHRTLPEDRIPLWHKCAHSSGMISFQLGNNAVAQLANPVFNILLGVPASWIGGVLMATRLWDALTDPLVGWLSDNTRSRWGRRKPYIVVGSILFGVVYALLWLVPEAWGEASTLAYFAIGTLLFYTCFTIFAVPYKSQAFELTPDYHERTRLMAVRAYFGKAANILVPWVFAIAYWDAFASPMQGIRVFGGLLGIMIVLTAIPTLFVRERSSKVARKQKQSIPLFTSVSRSLRNGPFLALLVLTISTQLTAMMVSALGLYVSIYHVFGGNEGMGALWGGYVGTTMVVVGAISIPIIQWLATRYGKVRAMAIILLVSCFSDLIKWFCYTPEAPALQLVVPLLMAPSMTGFWLLVNSMKADIPDYDELHSGLRQEGMYSAVATWMQKLGMASSFILTGFIIDGVGFDPELGGDQSESTIFWMRVYFVIIPAIGNLLSLAALAYYPLNEDRMWRIRRILERRRGTY